MNSALYKSSGVRLTLAVALLPSPKVFRVPSMALDQPDAYD